MTQAAVRRGPMPALPEPYDEAGWREWVERHPIAELMRMECLAASPGHVRVRTCFSMWPLLPDGSFHRGLVSAYADQCLGTVSLTTSRPGAIPATAGMTTEFLQPALPPLTFDAQVHRSGRTIVFVGIDVFDRDDRLCARVSGLMAATGNNRFEALKEIPS